MKGPNISSRIDLKVETSVNPSEDYTKVIDAVTNVIDGCIPEFKYGSRVVGRATGSSSLNTVYTQVRSRSAMGVLRRMLIYHKTNSSTWFLLNKQAAAAGIAVIIEDEQESPLGPIRVTIDCEDLDDVIEWLVPE